MLAAYACIYFTSVNPIKKVMRLKRINFKIRSCRQWYKRTRVGYIICSHCSHSFSWRGASDMRNGRGFITWPLALFHPVACRTPSRGTLSQHRRNKRDIASTQEIQGRFKSTVNANEHRRVSYHRNTAMWGFNHRNTAQETEHHSYMQHCTPQTPMSPRPECLPHFTSSLLLGL